MADAIALISLIFAGLSIATSVAVLLLALIIYRDKQLRSYLMRFSIRVLLHFEFVAILAALANILTITTTTNNTTCVASAYMQALLMNVLNSLASLVTLNFFMVLCLNINNFKSAYGILAVWIICLAFTTPALGLGYFGMDPVQGRYYHHNLARLQLIQSAGVCWVALPNSHKRHLVEAISSWTICLTCAVLSMASATLVLSKLHRRSRVARQLGLACDRDMAERHKTKIILKILVFPLLVLIIDGCVIGATISSEYNQSPFDHNSTDIPGDFVSIPYWVSLLSQILLNCPGFVVGIAIFFVDPSFGRALRAWLRKHRGDIFKQNGLTQTTSSRSSMSIDQPPKQHLDDSILSDVSESPTNKSSEDLVDSRY